MIDFLAKAWPMVAGMSAASVYGLALAYRISQAVTRIEVKLEATAKTSDDHESRLRRVEMQCAGCAK